MSGWRFLTVTMALCAALLGLNACTSPQALQLDALTQPEPDSTRQRAMRRLTLASAYFEQGQTDVAQQEVRAALQIDANYAEAYGLLGLIHQRNQSTALAQQSFEKALALASEPHVRTAELAAIQHNYGWFLCQQKRWAQAQTQFTLALAQPGYNQAAKTWMAQGLCQAQAGDARVARQSLAHALALEPSNPLTRYHLAQLAWQAHDFNSAEQTLAPLNASAQASAQSLWLGIQLARQQQRSQDMHNLAQQLTQRFPSSTQAQAWAHNKLEDR